jgi:hypothetical protein
MRNTKIWLAALGLTAGLGFACGKVPATNPYDPAGDAAAPTSPAIAINEGMYAGSVTVSILISAVDANEMMVSNDPGFGETAWEAYATSKTWEFSSGDGLKTVYAKFRDLPGNVSDRAEASIFLDTQSPGGILTIEGNSEFSTFGDGSVLLSLAPFDGEGSGVTKVLVSNNGSDYSEYDFNPSLGWYLDTATEGKKTIYVRFRDRAGNLTSIPLEAGIYWDPSPPTPLSFSINSGDQYTTSRFVILSLSASGADYILVANDAAFAQAQEYPYTDQILWILPAGEGEKTIYAKFRDWVGNETQAYLQDSIIVDTIPPTSPNLRIVNGDYSNTVTVPVTLSAVGADQMIISESPAFSGAAWTGYATGVSFSVSAGDGRKVVYAKFRDLAGNESQVASDSTILDTVSPANPGIAINNGAVYTRSVSVTLALAASGAAEMKVYNQGQEASADWQPYSPFATFLLSSGEGNKTVSVKYRDQAGNESSMVSSQIVLDTVSPTNPQIGTESQIVDAGSPLNLFTMNLELLSTDANFLTYQIAGGQNPEFSPSYLEAIADPGVRIPVATSGFIYRLNENAENMLRVRAVDWAGNLSDEDFVIITEDSTAPLPPLLAGVEENADSITIRWLASQSPDVIGYKIYYGIAPNALVGNFAMEGASPLQAGSALQLKLTGLQNNFNLYFALSAVDRFGHEGFKGSVQSARTSSKSFISLAKFGGKYQKAVIVGDYLYLLVGSNLEIYEITDPASFTLALRNRQKISGDHLDLEMYSGSGQPLAVILDLDGMVHIVDVGDPDDPREIGQVQAGETGMDYQDLSLAWPTIAVAMVDPTSSTNNGLIIINASNPCLPVKVKKLAGGVALAKLDADGGYIFGLESLNPGNNIYTFAVTSPVQASLLSAKSYFSNLSLQNLRALGGRLYVNFRDNICPGSTESKPSNVMVLDAGDPAHQHFLAGFWPITTGVCSPNPSNEQFNDLDVDNGYAILAVAGGGFRLFDVSNPSSPLSLDGKKYQSYNGDQVNLERLAGGQRYALALDDNYGLRSFQVAPAPADFTMTLEWQAAHPCEAYDAASRGGYAYVACGSSGLLILDVTDPVNPVQVAQFDTPGSVRAVKVSDRFAFLADYTKGVYAVDIADPEHPVSAGWFAPQITDTTVRPMDLYAEANTLYVAAESSDGVTNGKLYRVNYNWNGSFGAPSNINVVPWNLGLLSARGDYIYVPNLAGSTIQVVRKNLSSITNWSAGTGTTAKFAIYGNLGFRTDGSRLITHQWAALELGPAAYKTMDLMEATGEQRDVLVASNMVAIADKSYLLTVDLANLRLTYDLEIMEKHPSGGTKRLTLDQLMLYLSRGAYGLEIGTFAKVSAPEEKLVWNTPGMVGKPQINGPYLYGAITPIKYFESVTIQIVETADPGSLTGMLPLGCVSTVPYFVNYLMRAWVINGDYAYVLLEDRPTVPPDNPDLLLVFNIANHNLCPAPLVRTKNLGVGASRNSLQLQVYGRYLFMYAPYGNTTIFDLADPTNPAQVASFLPTANGAWDMSMRGMYAYFAGGSAGVKAWNLANPASPQAINYSQAQPPAAKLITSASRLFTHNDSLSMNKISRFNISSPTADPVELDYYPVQNNVISFLNSGNLLFTNKGYGDGVLIFDISNPVNFSLHSLINSMTSTYYDHLLTVNGFYGFYVDGSYGLRIIDLSR